MRCQRSRRRRRSGLGRSDKIDLNRTGRKFQVIFLFKKYSQAPLSILSLKEEEEYPRRGSRRRKMGHFLLSSSSTSGWSLFFKPSPPISLPRAFVVVAAANHQRHPFTVSSSYLWGQLNLDHVPQIIISDRQHVNWTE